MSRLLWVLGWIGVAIWSLLAFSVYGLIDVFGKAAMRNADAFSTDPETVEWIWRVLSWAHSLSSSAVLVGWGLGALAVLAVPWLFDRLVAARRASPAPVPRERRDGVIDLSPEDYTVRTGTPGPAPRIGRSG